MVTIRLSHYLTTFVYRAEMISYLILINAIKQGFPSKNSITKPEIYDFWEVQYRLSNDKVLMDGRIVPTLLALSPLRHG